MLRCANALHNYLQSVVCNATSCAALCCAALLPTMRRTALEPEPCCVAWCCAILLNAAMGCGNTCAALCCAALRYVSCATVWATTCAAMHCAALRCYYLRNTELPSDARGCLALHCPPSCAALLPELRCAVSGYAALQHCASQVLHHCTFVHAVIPRSIQEVCARESRRKCLGNEDFKRWWKWQPAKKRSP